MPSPAGTTGRGFDDEVRARQNTYTGKPSPWI